MSLKVLGSQFSNHSEVVIIYAKRTPICKARKGKFKDILPEDLLYPVLKDFWDQNLIQPEKFGDIVIGNCLGDSINHINSRLAQKKAGIPLSIPCQTVNRQCSSGLMAASIVYDAIQAGQYEIGISGGFEIMSIGEMEGLYDVDKAPKELFNHQQTQNVLLPMGITSDNVAKEFTVSRADCDEFALKSNNKAILAQKNGYFKNEIVPIKITLDGKEITIEEDEGPRETSIEKLSNLKSSFGKGMPTTAGNSSQISDGAAVVVLAKRSFALIHNLPILARFKGYAVAGCRPEVMGIGPIYAIPKLMKQVGMNIQNIDIFEINEAFATQALVVARKLGIEEDKINPQGGAIALGHPLGATGSRAIATLIYGMKRLGKKRGVVSMCIGTGMGAACYIELE